MKFGNLFFALMVTAGTVLADGLPVITTQPQNSTRSPGLPVTFSVVSANAALFQWRFNGADMPGATNSTLQIASPQTTNSGYYVVVAKNATGWVPSQLGYLAVVASSGTVPFSKRAIYMTPLAQRYCGFQLNFAARGSTGGVRWSQVHSPILQPGECQCPGILSSRAIRVLTHYQRHGASCRWSRPGSNETRRHRSSGDQWVFQWRHSQRSDRCAGTDRFLSGGHFLSV